MFKVKVLKRFCDEEGVTHEPFEKTPEGRFIYDDRLNKINIVKTMKDKSAKCGEKIGAVQILEKIKKNVKTV